MEDYTIVEKYQQRKNKTIAIRPYFNPSKQNMGLENYNMSLHDGVYHEETLACLEMNGVKRYVTGLNEFAPEIKSLPSDEREAKVKQIRKAVSDLEKELNSNVVDPEDKDFWNQLSNEELKHEAILRSIQNTIALSGDFTSGLSNNLLQDVIKTKEWVSSLLVNFSKNPPDRKTAFEAATQIEKTASEVHYQGVMCQEADSWFIQTLQKLNEFDLDHLVRIERYIQEKNII